MRDSAAAEKFVVVRQGQYLSRLPEPEQPAQFILDPTRALAFSARAEAETAREKLRQSVNPMQPAYVYPIVKLSAALDGWYKANAKRGRNTDRYDAWRAGGGKGGRQDYETWIKERKGWGFEE